MVEAGVRTQSVFEDRLRWLLDSSPDAIIVTDLNGTIINCNTTSLRVYGFSSKEELIGRNGFDLVVSKNRQRIKEESDRTLERNTIENNNSTWEGLDGHELLAEVNSNAINNCSNKSAVFVIISNEIKDHKQTKKECNRFEPGLRTIFDNTTDGIMIADPDTKRFHDCNKTLCQMLGYTREEIRNMGIMEIHPEEDLIFVIEEFEKQLNGDQTLARDIPVKKRDGSVFYADINSSPIVLDNKKYLMGILRDVTDRNKTETRLALLSNAVQMSTDSIVISDLNVNIVDVNEATVKMYGAEDKAWLIGKNSLDIIAPEERSRAIKDLKETLDKGFVKNREYHVITKYGDKILVEMSTAIMKDADGEPVGYVAVSRDITKRKKMEDELRNTLKELKSKNKELDDFVYVASHDLKAPLVTIQGFADLLKKKYGNELSKGALHYIDTITSGAENLSKLVSDLLALSRASRIKPVKAKVELTDVVRSSIEALQTMIDENEVVISVPENPLEVSYDPTHLEEVFTNLLVNAIKYSKPNTKPKIEIGWRSSTDENLIWVKDNGRGIEQKNLIRIFQPFVRIGIDQKGTGIGLSIIKKIVERHGGRIWADSKFGEGSTFNFTIPKEV